MLLSFAMIGVVGKDRARPPELLGEHRARHEMRPGRLAEGDRQVRARPLRVGETVRRADQEADFANALVLPVADPAGQIDGAQLPARLVERHDFRTGRGGRDLAAAVRQFSDPDRPADPLDIALDKLGFRAAADLAAGDDVQGQAQLSPAASSCSPNPHIRSRL